MARLKHIAIRTHDIESTARFYMEAFDLKKVGDGKSGIYLTDGYLNIAILSLRTPTPGETMKLGLDHIGFQVDDINAAVKQVRQAGGSCLEATSQTSTVNQSAGAQSYFEVKCVAPDNQIIDISNAGWTGAH